MDNDDDEHSLQAMLCYAGGKHRLAKRIVEIIPDHCTYVEPFCGGASIFWRKSLASKNVIADIDPELINFYKVMRDYSETNLLKSLDKLWIPDEKLYYKYRDKLRACLERNQCLPNPDRGIIFGYIIEFSYGCKGAIGSWGFKKFCRDCDYPMIQDVINHFKEYQAKLKRTKIEHGDYKGTMKKYDSSCTFFYLDPPYYQTRKVTKFAKVDPHELADFVRTIRGKFLLSYDNAKEHYDIFNGFNIVEITRIGYDLKRRYDRNRGEAKELLIANYPIKGV